MQHMTDAEKADEETQFRLTELQCDSLLKEKRNAMFLYLLT
jgi:hypothetical protein